MENSDEVHSTPTENLRTEKWVDQVKEIKRSKSLMSKSKKSSLPESGSYIARSRLTSMEEVVDAAVTKKHSRYSTSDAADTVKSKNSTSGYKSYTQKTKKG